MKIDRVAIVGFTLVLVATDLGIKLWYGQVDLLVFVFTLWVCMFLYFLCVIKRRHSGLLVSLLCVMNLLMLSKFEQIYLASLALSASCFFIYYAAVYRYHRLYPAQPSV